jgi:dipeptidyl aminopeptidase/acylaminoacyl peptidase
MFLSVSVFGSAFQDIVYISDRSGHWEIWKTSTKDPGSSSRVTELNGSGNPSMPKWSPDGKWIAFVMDRDIYVVASEGNSSPIRLTDTVSPNYLMGPDFGVENDWVYYIKVWPARGGEIWRVNIDSRTTEPVNQRANTNFQTFDVSACGNYRVEMRENGCCWTPNMYTVLYNLIDQTEKVILGIDGNAEWSPRFDKEAEKIVFSQANRYYNPYSLWMVNSDGTGIQQITFPAGNVVHQQPVWAPDSIQVLYQSNENGNWDLYIIDTENGLNMPFLATPYNELHPDWYYGPDKIEAEIDVNPDVINLKSKGNWITVYITLPDGYNVYDIDSTTLKMQLSNSYLEATRGSVQGNLFMAKFDRTRFKSLINGTTGNITVIITGMVGDTEFEGTDLVFVKK